MLSANGAIVFEKMVQAQAGTNSATINNLSAVPNGLYFIQYNDGSRFVNLKLMVRH
jgi:hypothetical protein